MPLTLTDAAQVSTLRPRVPKSQPQRLEELRKALVIIEKALRDAFETGEEAHFIPVVNQLRALLANRRQTPLLVDLAQELGFPLEFYSIRLDFLDIEEIARIYGPNRIQWTGDSISPKAEPPLITQKVTMKEWLLSTQGVVGQKKIFGEELLKEVANTLGGAHYDRGVPPWLAAIGPFRLAGVPSCYLTLARLGEVVVCLGQALLEHSKAEGREL